MNRIAALAFTMALAGLSGAARAEVVDRSEIGFEARIEETIAAPPEKVRAALLDISGWWSPDHSYSGDARNLTLDLTAGCFCERLKDGGFVRHMSLVYADARTIRLFGALGPLQTTGASGHLAFVLKPAPEGTRLVVTYDVGGYARGGLAQTWAGPVDGVLAAQVKRLKAYAEKAG